MFKFTDLAYVETGRGIEIHGSVQQDGRKVGTFSCDPFAATVARFTDAIAAKQFHALGIDPELYLLDAENELLEVR